MLLQRRRRLVPSPHIGSGEASATTVSVCAFPPLPPSPPHTYYVSRRRSKHTILTYPLRRSNECVCACVSSVPHPVFFQAASATIGAGRRGGRGDSSAQDRALLALSVGWPKEDGGGSRRRRRVILGAQERGGGGGALFFSPSAPSLLSSPPSPRRPPPTALAAACCTYKKWSGVKVGAEEEEEDSHLQGGLIVNKLHTERRRRNTRASG